MKMIVFSSPDEVYAAIGFLGGLVLAFAQIPQIYRVQSRKSSSDISYAYQVRPLSTPLCRLPQHKAVPLLRALVARTRSRRIRRYRLCWLRRAVRL